MKIQSMEIKFANLHAMHPESRHQNIKILGGGKALMARPLREELFFCGFPKGNRKKPSGLMAIDFLFLVLIAGNGF